MRTVPKQWCLPPLQIFNSDRKPAFLTTPSEQFFLSIPPEFDIIGKKEGRMGIKMGRYDVAQICLKGHVINPSAKKFPKLNKKFCPKCGSETTTNCQKCDNPIQGQYHPSGTVRLPTYSMPSFCQYCGAPFPWIEAKIKAFRDYAELLEIPREDKKVLEESVPDIVVSTETTAVSATRFKKVLTKAGKNALEGAKEIVIDIISETAKKIIWP